MQSVYNCTWFVPDISFNNVLVGYLALLQIVRITVNTGVLIRSAHVLRNNIWNSCVDNVVETGLITCSFLVTVKL